MREVLENADVVLSTTTSASEGGPLKHLPNRHFDLLIIDEAAQALEVSCWIPMLKVSRSVFIKNNEITIYISTEIIRKPTIYIWKLSEKFYAKLSFNPFHATGLFLYLLKTSSENVRFLKMFSGGIERDQWHEIDQH